MWIQSDLIRRDLKHIWHPCSQMKDYELFQPLEVIGAEGSHIILKNHKKIIDAISSWWCKSLGHGNPRLKAALIEQIHQFEHVILANTTNETIIELSEKLAELTRTLDKVMFASDGSSVVEMALKMSLHARQIMGQPERHVFIALENGFHGETVGALSVSDLRIYKGPYRPILFKSHFITPLPYVNGEDDPRWHDCSAEWQKIAKSLHPFCETATALIVEPIVQGAGNMKIYSKDFLYRLRQWTLQHDVHFIADEIMTGVGRTGKMLACEHAGIEPDFLCLAKGLTAGWLPMSVMLTSQKIYDLFYGDYELGKSFLHSHTHSGNVLAARLAVEVLKIMAEEKICTRVVDLGFTLRNLMQEIAYKTQKLINVRGVGGMVAADLVDDNSGRRLGYEVYRHAVSLGALLRPLGNTIYWLPPLTIEIDTLVQLKTITEQAILKTYSN